MYLPKWSGLYVHVKWFTEDHVWNPQPMTKVITPAFLLWLGVTLAALLVCVLFSESLERIGLVHRVHQFLNGLKRYQLLILRVGVGLGLLMQLSTGTYLAPAFVSDHVWVYAVLILAIAGLLHRRLLVVSGAALAVLYGYSLITYGLFHGLDYFSTPALFITCSSPRAAGSNRLHPFSTYARGCPSPGFPWKK